VRELRRLDGVDVNEGTATTAPCGSGPGGRANSGGGGAAGTPYAPDNYMKNQRNRRRSPPTDEEVRDIAAELTRAVRRPPPDDPRDNICSALHELPPEDEDRVIAALAAFATGRGVA
jgi:hypothetical protein